jgi:hypothetical protein
VPCAGQCREPVRITAEFFEQQQARVVAVAATFWLMLPAGAQMQGIAFITGGAKMAAANKQESLFCKPFHIPASLPLLSSYP